MLLIYCWLKEKYLENVFVGPTAEIKALIEVVLYTNVKYKKIQQYIDSSYAVHIQMQVKLQNHFGSKSCSECTE